MSDKLKLPVGTRVRVDYSILQHLKVPMKTEVELPIENEWEHMQRTGHKRYFYERMKGDWVVTCTCGEQVFARFSALAKYGPDKEMREMK